MIRLPQTGTAMERRIIRDCFPARTSIAVYRHISRFQTLTLRHSSILRPTSDECRTLTAEPNNDGAFGYDKHCAASRSPPVVNGNLNNGGFGRIVRKSEQFGEYL